MAWKVPEQFRISPKHAPSKKGDPFGWFQIPSPDKNRVTKTNLMCLASDGMKGVEWEHVSIRAVKNFNGKWKDLIPTWAEMCFIKQLFWDDEDVVMQLHPRKSDYVNIHESVLHLWRPKTIEIPTPPKIVV